MASSDPATWSVRELKSALAARGVDITGLTEKHELVALLMKAPAPRPQ